MDFFENAYQRIPPGDIGRPQWEFVELAGSGAITGMSSMWGADGKPDVQKIQPFCYDHLKQEYYGIGKVVGKAFSDGRTLKK